MFRNISAITFKLGNYCNLQCSYCFQRKEIKETHDTFNKYNELLEFLSNPKITYTDELEFKVTGGEPSLYIEEIRYAYKILKKLERVKDVRVRFTTICNGADIDSVLELMDEGILRPDGCKLSWDGLYTSDNSRYPKDSKYNSEFYKEVVSKIGRSKYASDILVRSALLDSTVDTMVESFQYAIDQGCRKIEYYYINDNEDYRSFAFADKFSKMLTDLYDRIAEWDKVKVANIETLIYADQTSEEDKLRAINCRHLGKMLYIEHNGDIAPCGFFSDDAFEDGCKLTIGNIEKGFYKDIVESFIAQYKEVPMCYDTKCPNMHCFECPAVNLYRTQHMQNKLMMSCALRSIERSLFYKNLDRIPLYDYGNVANTFNYTREYSIDYSLPELNWYES